MYRYRILYAEDEEATRINYTRYLERLFEKVYAVPDGQAALEAYHAHHPDILLLDINMPHHSGLEVAKRIRKQDKTTRILILTAHLERDKLLFATELGLTKYLPKPIQRGELKSALVAAVAQLEEMQGAEAEVWLGEGYLWHPSTRQLHHHTEQIKLTRYEILLLELLLSKEGQIFSADEIALHLWNDDVEAVAQPRKIKDIIKRIRKKLPEGVIENVYGVGFRLKPIP
jgi:DNA-binding response OmpR family regulator